MGRNCLRGAQSDESTMFSATATVAQIRTESNTDRGYCDHNPGVG